MAKRPWMTLHRSLSAAISAVLLTGTVWAAPAHAASITSAGSSGSTAVYLTAVAATFDVTVPSVLPITVDDRGVVTVAENAQVVNNSAAAVKISHLNIVGENGWEIVPFETNMTLERMDAKKLGMSLNGVMTGMGNFDQDVNFSSLAGKNSAGSNALPIEYDAVVSPVSASVMSTTVASVVITVGWDTP